MSSNPTVSVVMPVYNAGEFLRPALASIFAQTLTDWELIAVDDASTDGSWEYLQRIDDPRVRVFHNERNVKQAYTQNRGIDLARGRWIARMDADDISFPTRLERQAAALEADQRLDVLGCGVFMTDRELNPILVRRPPATHAGITRWASLNFPLTHGTMMGKREWWMRWRCDPRARLAQDFDLLFKAHRESTFANVEEPLYVYRFAGHTRSWAKMTRSVYYKGRTLCLHGFRRGIFLQTLMGLASLAPRPILYAIKQARRQQTGLTKGQGMPPDETDILVLRRGIAEAAKAEVPLAPAHS